MKMMKMMKTASWQELLFACASVLSPYLLAWLVLAVTQG